MKRVAILGATGHIARGLIERLAGAVELQRFSRSQDNIDLWPLQRWDVVINCVGVAEALWTEPYRIFTTIERFDNAVLDYCLRNPDTLYINFSSGAVFGSGFLDPVSEGTKAVIDVQGMQGSAPSFYGIVKLNSEAKHRSLQDLNIADLRVYSYFSRHLRRDSRCIMSELISCIAERREFETSRHDFMRDYVHPDDLAELVRKVIGLHSLNRAFDVYSRRPVSKFELLEMLEDRFGLAYRVRDDFPETSPTGPKPCYYSTNLDAAELGYVPQYTSLEGIEREMEKILGKMAA